MSRQLYFLHVSKTGGTALRKLLDAHNEAHDNKITRLGHDVTFRMIRVLRPGARIVFFIRDPIERAESGFYDRYRKGQPAYFYEWSKRETRAFAQFQDFNALAEALSSNDELCKRSAQKAMKAIRHLRWSLKHFLISPRFLARNRHRIFFLGDQGAFDQDIEDFRKKAGIDVAAKLPIDHVGAHRSSAAKKPPLSTRAIANLKTYYAQDFAIYEWCQQNKALINQTATDWHGHKI